MKSLLALVGFLSLTLALAGVFCGWVRVEHRQISPSEPKKIEAVADPAKISSDMAAAIARVLEMIKTVQEGMK